MGRLKNKRLPIAMTVPVAEAIVGPLGRPSKMPGRAWGISTASCKRGSLLAQQPDTVCSRCYAARGRYMTGSVQRCQARRLEALEHPQWAEAMAFLINAYNAHGHFRWLDSGDLQGLAHLDKIADVCRRTPTVAHWLPTHETYLVGEWLASGNSIPSNLVIRISADVIESAPTAPTHGLPTSTVHRHKGEPVPVGDQDPRRSVECRAYARGFVCGTCRACWDPRVQNVSYPLH